MKVIAAVAVVAGMAFSACSNRKAPEDSLVTKSESRVAPNKVPVVTKPRESAPTAPIKPVRIGFSPELDACTVQSEVSHLDPKGDNYLSVRTEPRADAKEIDRLGPRTSVDECDYDGDFVGIVYPAPEQDYALCGTGGAVATERDYRGPCRSGWVSKKYLTQVAG